MNTLIMKTKTKILLMTLSLGLILNSCSSGENEKEPIYEAMLKGTMSIEPILKNVIIATTGKAPTLEEVLDNMTVLIQDTEGNQVLSVNYRDLPEFIELAQGVTDFLCLIGELRVPGLTIPSMAQAPSGSLLLLEKIPFWLFP